jgi:hypothetical protein
MRKTSRFDELHSVMVLGSAMEQLEKSTCHERYSHCVCLQQVHASTLRL